MHLGTMLGLLLVCMGGHVACGRADAPGPGIECKRGYKENCEALAALGYADWPTRDCSEPPPADWCEENPGCCPK